jgi:hypothetical protein
MVNQQHANRMQLQALQEVTTEPLGWWWLSFATSERFLGVCIVEAHGIITAVLEASRKEINPGGAVQAYPFPPGNLVPRWVNQLLTRHDVQEMDTWLYENYPDGPQGGSSR